MSEKAKLVWEIAKKHQIETLVESQIDDLEAFAAELDCDNEKLVLEYLYRAILFQAT